MEVGDQEDVGIDKNKPVFERAGHKRAQAIGPEPAVVARILIDQVIPGHTVFQAAL